MKRIIFSFLFCFQLFSIGVSAQEKFDIVSFKTPAGWQKSVESNAAQFSKQEGTGVAIMMLFKSIPTSKDSKTTFDASWNSIVKDLLTKVDAPKMQPAANENGWTIESGAAVGEKDGNKLIAMLLSATGGGKVVNLLILYNSESFQADIEKFISSIDLEKVSQNSAENNPTSTENSQKIASSFAELDGNYPGCLTGGYSFGSSALVIKAGKIPKFTIKNGSYTVYQGKGGKVDYTKGIVTFTGGEFDGWKAVSEILKDGSYTLLFRVDHYKTLPFGTASRVGDEQCYRQTAGN